MGLSWPAGFVPWRKNIIHSFILTAPTPCTCCGAKPKFQLSITDIVLTHTQFVNISVRQLGLEALYNQMITFVTPATNSI